MSSPVTAQLILIQGESSGFQSTIELNNRNLSIGRAQNCDIVWGSLQISRKHATLEYMVPKWYIRDSSTNGLSVNGTKLVKGELYPLKDLDMISFIPTGIVRYRFKYVLPTSPTRGAPPTNPTTSEPQTSSISPQPSTSRSALADSVASIPRSSVITKVSRPSVIEIRNRNSDDSNHSESLLSLDAHDDYFSFSADENAQSPSVDVDSDNASSGLSIPKRKHKVLSSDDSDSNAVVDRKKKRIQLAPISSEDDDESRKSDKHIASSSSNFKALRLPCKGKIVTEEEIRKCRDPDKLHVYLTEILTHLTSTEVRLETVEFERTIEREDKRKQEQNARSANAAFKEETYKKILEFMESELSCAVCNEVFIQATVIDCGHTFCHFCINEWGRKKNECPICRKAFRNRSRHIEMENFISKVFESFSEELATRRTVSIKEREEQVKKAADDARTAENQARAGNVGGFALVDFIAELHNNFGEIYNPPRVNGRGGNAAANAERRRSARIQDRVIDAVVAGAGTGGAQGPVRGRHRGRGRAAANAAANNVQGAAAPPAVSVQAPIMRVAASRQFDGPTRNLNPIPVVTLNDTDDAPGGSPGMRIPNYIQNQFMNYVRRFDPNLLGDANRNENGELLN